MTFFCDDDYRLYLNFLMRCAAKARTGHRPLCGDGRSAVPSGDGGEQ